MQLRIGEVLRTRCPRNVRLGQISDGLKPRIWPTDNLERGREGEEGEEGERAEATQMPFDKDIF